MNIFTGPAFLTMSPGPCGTHPEGLPFYRRALQRTLHNQDPRTSGLPERPAPVSGISQASFLHAQPVVVADEGGKGIGQIARHGVDGRRDRLPGGVQISLSFFPICEKILRTFATGGSSAGVGFGHEDGTLRNIYTNFAKLENSLGQ